MYEEGDNLFSKFVNVILKDYDQKTISLNISIYNTPTAGPGQRRELYIRLTTPDDLLFLQTLALSEDDFQALKHQQGLLVDYGAFPQKFIDLLELCIKDQTSTSPRFILHLTTGGMSSSHGLLEVVETNPFKHLVHLSLKFVPGNDEAVKRYLASCLKVVKEEKEQTQRQLNESEKDLTNKLSNMHIALQDKTEEFESAKVQSQEKLAKVKEKYEADLKKEKEHSAQLRHNYEHRLEDETRSNGERYNHVVGDLETKLNATLASNKALTDQKYKYEALIRDLKSQVNSLDDQKQLKSKDLDKLRLQNHHLDSDRHERDKTLNHLKTRVAVLEQEIKNKDHMIKQTSQLMENANEQKIRSEGELEKKNAHVTQLENSVNSVSSEVIKGNEIIKKLQMEIKSLKSRVKMMAIVTTKQEKLIEEKDISLSHLSNEKTSQQATIKSLEGEISALNESVKESSGKLSEAQETFKNNENVINWLNKQLNEYTISRTSNNTALRTTSNISNIAASRIGNSTNSMNIFPSNRPMTTIRGQTSHNILPAHRPSTLSHINNTNSLMRGDNENTENFRNTTFPQRGENDMPYDGRMFGKPRFQTDNISPIIPQPRYPLREKQTNSTPCINEESSSEPILDSKYLIRRCNEKSDADGGPLKRVSEGDENMDPSPQHRVRPKNTATPFIVSSSCFNSKAK